VQREIERAATDAHADARLPQMEIALAPRGIRPREREGSTDEEDDAAS
jgi:hypothetical protein